jgi:hypothetical protein
LRSQNRAIERDLADHPLGGDPGPGKRRDTQCVDPLAPLRPVNGRLAPRVEALAQAVAERAVELVVSALDVNGLLDRVDLNAVLDQVDLNAVLDQVDLNAVLDQVDIERVLDRVDLDRLLRQVDVNAVVERIDVDALVEQTDLGAVIARSSSGVASDALDVVRSQTVGLDEFIARWIGRLRRRPYTGPPGPPDALRAGAAS